ncbi:MAG: polymer-forming cytoskeletal protein [Anaerolineales bacterium]|nr:polymer-forming cytoskeletal protein [Anaerolineales bacterium]
MRTPRLRTYIILVLSAAMSAGALLAQQSDGAVTTGDQVAEDRYIAGGSVKVLEEIEGDAVLAGGVVNVSGFVSGDVLAAGGFVIITADTGDDVRSAGGSVAIVGNVGNDVTAAGGLVTIDARSTVGGRAWLSGRIVNVDGNVNRDLSVNGGRVTVTGTIGGNVEIYADSIEIESGAVISGSVTYSSPEEAVVHEGAVIEGAVNRQTFDPGDIETWGAGISGSVKFYLSLALSAIVLFLVCPHTSARLVQPLRDSAFKSLGLGILVFFATPLLTLALLISVLGIPLGLIALTLFIVALVGGLLVAMIWIGEVIFRLLGQNPDSSKWMRLLSIISAAAILLIIDLIPYIGGLVYFAVLLLGFGAVTLHCYRSETGSGGTGKRD